MVYNPGLVLATHMESKKDSKGSRKQDFAGRKTVLCPLILDKAACYSDVANPSNNTAEWNFLFPNRVILRVWDYKCH